MMALVFGTAGVLLGAVIVFLREPAVFLLGVLGLALGWSYHGSPLQLVYHGLGELDVVLCYGPVIVLATFLIHTGTVGVEPLLLSLPLGILIAAFLWVNEFPDHDADGSWGNATWSVWRKPIDFYRSRPVQPMTLIAFVTYSIAAAAGALIA